MWHYVGVHCTQPDQRWSFSSFLYVQQLKSLMLRKNDISVTNSTPGRMNYTQRPIPALLIMATTEGEAAVLLQWYSREELWCYGDVLRKRSSWPPVPLQHYAVCFGDTQAWISWYMEQQEQNQHAYVSAHRLSQIYKQYEGCHRQGHPEMSHCVMHGSMRKHILRCFYRSDRTDSGFISVVHIYYAWTYRIWPRVILNDLRHIPNTAFSTVTGTFSK